MAALGLNWPGSGMEDGQTNLFGMETAMVHDKPNCPACEAEARARPNQGPGTRLLEAASRLFCREGIHATGIDRILAEAGVAKMTLYKHFGSKEGLVAAVLEMEGRQWRDWVFAEVTRRATTPAGRLEALFDVLADWFGQEHFYGCAFINAVAEHNKDDPRIRSLALAHKKAFLAFVESLCVQLGSRDPGALAHRIGLIIDGAIVVAMITRSAEAATTARETVLALVRADLDAAADAA